MSLEIAWDTSCIYMYTIFFTTPNYEYPHVIHILLVQRYSENQTQALKLLSNYLLKHVITWIGRCRKRWRNHE